MVGPCNPGSYDFDDYIDVNDTDVQNVWNDQNERACVQNDVDFPMVGVVVVIEVAAVVLVFLLCIHMTAR